MAFRSRDLGVKLAAENALCLGNSECLKESGCGGTQVCAPPTKCDEKSCHPTAPPNAGSHLAGLELLRAQLRESLGSAAR